MLGMAGGDGSQGAAAAVAAEFDVPYVCVPAGTRNHFALDVGVDPNDLIGALEAFLDGTERRIDLARVNNRVFVNNASMGLYGRIVQSRDYRDAKLRTVIEKLPDLVGPAAEPIRPQVHRARREESTPTPHCCSSPTTRTCSTPDRDAEPAARSTAEPSVSSP